MCLLKNKLVIGTVQFGMDYGISNAKGVTTFNEALSILDTAKSYGINTLDTAIIYGRSEEVLGKLDVKQFRVISKVPTVTDDISNVSVWFEKQIRLSLKRMNINRLHALLLHNPSQLMSSRGSDIYKALLDLKNKGLVKKIGVSIYVPEELDKIANRFHFDIVQSPFNIFDRRIIESGWAKKLSDNNIELHARSIFLQGLLLMNKEDRPKKFDKWSQAWSAWDNWLEKRSVSAIEACVSFATQQTFIKKVIIGFENLKQFNQVIKSNNDSLKEYPIFPALDETLVNPSKWKEL